MPAFEVTAAGFQSPRLPEARARVVEVWRGRFGDNAQVDSATPDGLIVDTLALLLALAWEGIGGVWSRSFFQTADGVALDLLLDLFARKRFAAAQSTVDVVWYGDEGTVIGSGSLAFATDSEERFATLVAGELADTCWVVTIDTVANAQLYELTVDGSNYDYTSDASATAAEIVAGLAAAIAGGGYTATGVVSVLGVGHVVIETAGIAEPTVVDGDMSVYAGARIPSASEEYGEVVGAVGTIAFAVTVIAGVEGVVNPEAAVLGRLQETDAQLRQRHLLALSASGRATPEAIRGRLLDNVDGVTYVRVVENEGATPDAAGRPPHSFETYVIGGDDDEVAAEIWASKPAGILAYGSTTEQVTDQLGDSHAVSFTRPTVLYGHARVTITPGEGYPTTGTPAETARQALATYLTGVGEPQLGGDVYRLTLHGPVTVAVPGIASLLVELDTTPDTVTAPTFVDADIVVAEGEIVEFALARITVLEV